jgi:hypothetical protein
MDPAQGHGFYPQHRKKKKQLIVVYRAHSHPMEAKSKRTLRKEKGKKCSW